MWIRTLLFMDVSSFVSRIVDSIVKTTVEAAPRIFSLLVFVVGAIVAYKIIDKSVKSAVSRISENKRDEKIIYLFIRSLVFLIIITVCLFILGFDELARVIGTLSGAIIIVVSYAMKEAIGEVVSGLYLIHDERFVEGNKVTADSVTGSIVEVGIRRTRIENEDNGDLTTISNSKVEPKWTYHKDSES